MGSAGVENCSQSDTGDCQKYQDLRLKRPDFYPCTDCGRKFTVRALQIHKRSCSETDDCICLVCKTSVKKKKCTEKNIFLLDSISDNARFDAKKNVKPRLHDLLTGKIHNGKHNNFNDGKPNVISFSLVDENCYAIDKIVAETKSLNGHCSSPVTTNENTVSDDHKYVSAPSESSNDSLPVPNQSENSPNNSSQMPKQNDKYDDHDGECNRKLFCTVCNEHIFWESFGQHVIQHCKIVENNYLKCPDCDKSYSKPALFLIHFFVHVSCHPLDCSDCQCANPECLHDTNPAMAEHCYAESIPFHCYICLNHFSHGQTIVNHMRLHSKEMPFTCTECKRSFRQIGNLQRHMTTHRGDRPHKCTKCSRSFADPATLRNHLRVHTGETPYVCSICGRGFTQVGNLKRHMALHLQKDPSSLSSSSTVEMVSDENNSMTIINPQDVKVEMNILNDSAENNSTGDSASASDSTSVSNSNLPSSESPWSMNVVKKFSPYNIRKNKRKTEKMKVFTCHICTKVYTWQHDLTIHIRTHTGEKPYKCEICEKRFAQSGAVRVHKRRHHKIIDNCQSSSEERENVMV